MTSLLISVPRGERSSLNVLPLTATRFEVPPSTHGCGPITGKPLGSRGVRGEPSTLRKSGHEPELKPMAWMIS